MNLEIFFINKFSIYFKKKKLFREKKKLFFINNFFIQWINNN